MAPRPAWKGYLKLSLVTCAVELTNVVTHTGPDAVTWQSKDRTVDGKELPLLKETKMKRVSRTTPDSQTNQ